MRDDVVYVYLSTSIEAMAVMREGNSSGTHLSCMERVMCA